jgi:glycosyltransferase involved in cell wall biosynthesis
MERWRIAESYSDPLAIYERALASGMSLVALTDHNSIDGALLLKERYGDRVITGVEATVCFPEDRCKVHLLVYGITEKEFADIQSLRKDIYELRAYLLERRLAHSVAHATYSVQAGKLTAAHLEKLIVLFNTFEVINGGRNRSDNVAWRYILERLTPDCLDDLCKKHSLEPFDAEPWKKGFTAGSDDHGGILIGKTYTEADGSGALDMLDALKNKRTSVQGRHSDYQTLAFSVYKVVHDFSRSASDRKAPTLLGQLSEMLFEGKKAGLAWRMRMRGLKKQLSKNGNGMYAPLHSLVDDLQARRSKTLEEAIGLVCKRVADFSDRSFTMVFDSLARDMGKIDFFGVVKSIQTSLPGLFLLFPFFITLRHLNEHKGVIGRLMSALEIERAHEGRRVLWFTDTLTDLNGVSVTLREVGRLALERRLDIKIVASMKPSDLPPDLPNVINLPFVHEFRLPYYESYCLKVPSVLNSLKEMYLFEPDRIHISTPGPVGLLGLLAAKLMNVKSVGFYHTDFTLQAKEIVEDESVSHMLESYMRWFYAAMDEVMVPTAQYMRILEARGFDPKKLKQFTRGIDFDLFKPQFSSGRAFLKSRFAMDGKTTLLYVGRISQDKGLDVLLEAFRLIAALRDDVRLLVVGDGPYLGELRAKAAPGPVTFAGRMVHEELPAVYGGSHLFVFPSATDTFGKVVLEAQACGLPAIVSDAGGPQELILRGRTGFVARAGDISDWKSKIDRMLDMIALSPGSYGKMREEARRWAVESFDWDDALGSIFEAAPAGEVPAEKKIA